VWFVVLVEEEDMPKIVVNAFLTLDGVMQAPGGPDEDRESGFQHGGWQAPLWDQIVDRLVTEGIKDADAFLLGRKTYEIFASYWPKVTDPDNSIATALNSRPKYVVSRSLERVSWNNSSLIKGDVVAEIRKLRQQPGRAVHTWGSTDMLQTLLKNDLIDEYRLFIYPVVLGSGKRLFGSGTVPVALKHVESVTTGTVATYHRLEPRGSRSTGGWADSETRAWRLASKERCWSRSGCASGARPVRR
jgi:dihydrofolate reductase